MACQISRQDGVTVIVCGPRGKYHRCVVRGCKKGAHWLCDWKMGEGKTCDRAVCTGHAQQVSDDKHLCPEHQERYREWQARRAANGA